MIGWNVVVYVYEENANGIRETIIIIIIMTDCTSDCFNVPICLSVPKKHSSVVRDLAWTLTRSVVSYVCSDTISVLFWCHEIANEYISTTAFSCFVIFGLRLWSNLETGT